MRQLLMGILIESALTGSLVWAGSFYDSKGYVQAPAGSQQSFDYYRQRQMFLDVQHMRERIERQTKPCAR